jgi:membrane protease YdiL (CAAX protease family)
VRPAKLGPDGRFVVDSGNWFVRRALIVYIAALVGAEGAALLFSIEFSLACYAALLFVLLTHLALFSSGRPELQAALAGLALVPTLEVGAVALPQRLVPEAYWEALPAALAFATVLALRGFVGPSLGGFRSWRASGLLAWGLQLVIAATGPLLALVAAFVLSALHRHVSEPALVPTRASILTVAAFSGLTLEIVFRGVVQPSLVRLFGPPGIALASLLYAGLFLGSGSGFLIVLGLVTGVIWGLLAAATRTVSGVAVSHALFALSWAALY